MDRELVRMEGGRKREKDREMVSKSEKISCNLAESEERVFCSHYMGHAGLIIGK